MSKDLIPFWEKSYQEYDTIAFSNEPNATITEFEHLIGKPSKILEVGCGEGQNAIYLAQQGYQVDAFDLFEYEIGFHLRPEFWGKGYAKEAADAIIDYAFSVLKAKKLFAGHNPNNIASQKVLSKLGFTYVGEEFYEPTGLFHPSYELENPD